MGKKFKQYRIEFTEADAHNGIRSVLVFEVSKVMALFHVVNNFDVYSLHSIERIKDEQGT
jgi:hypothetical protein